MDHRLTACAGVIEDLLYQPARRRAVGHASVFDGQPDHLHAVGLRRGDERWDTEQVELEVLEQGREQVDALRPKDIEIGTEAYDVTARELPDGERDATYPKIVALAPVFAEYQSKTARAIPLFELVRT